MMYDLDLRWPDGHVEAMEVTIAIDADLLRLGLRLARYGSGILAQESTRDWLLLLTPGTIDVRAITSVADRLLSMAEHAGVTSFSERDEREPVAAAWKLRRLGVAHGFSYEPRGTHPRITLVGPAPAQYFIQPESINKVVEDHARRNATKLALSGCEERHLLVLFDYTSPEGWHAFQEQRDPPELPPRLPEAITTVWAALPIGRTLPFGSRPVVWRVRRGGRWEMLL
jgi:hypothetical protein